MFLNNLDHPVNITNGPKGINQIDSIKFFGFDLGKTHKNMDDLSKTLGSSKSITISGFYPGSDGLYDYPIMLDGE